jgi:hypothetical protein
MSWVFARGIIEYPREAVKAMDGAIHIDQVEQTTTVHLQGSFEEHRNQSQGYVSSGAPSAWVLFLRL